MIRLSQFFPQRPRPKPRPLDRVHRAVAPTINYWFDLDSHVFAMAIASNVLFGFFPFMILMLSLAEALFAWSDAERAIFVGLRSFLPKDPGLVEFVERNLRVAVSQRGPVQFVPALLLILSANGIFMPLEAAQNRLWGFPRHRHYLFNQVVAFGFTTVAVVSAMAATVFAGTFGDSFLQLLGGWIKTPEEGVLVALKLVEAPTLLLLFLLIYWVLPNGPVPLRRALPVAIAAAATVEFGQLLYSWIWPYLELRREYGPFFISVTLVLWGFLAAMLVLAGAEVCSRPARYGADRRQPSLAAAEVP